MLEVVTIVLYTVVVIIALLLIGLVLIQQSKGGGFGSAFGGVGESIFGAHAGTHLTKFTVIMITAFFILVLALAIITGHREKPQSVVEITKDLLDDNNSSKPEATEKKGLVKAQKTVVMDKAGKKIPAPVLKKDIKVQEKKKPQPTK